MSSSSSVAATVAAAEEEGELGDHRRQRGEEARQRHHHHVAVDHVRELVCHHAFELGRVECVEDPPGGAHGRVLARAAHREGVGHRGLHHAHPRLGQIGLHAQPFDDAVQLRLIGGGDLLDPHRGHRDLVGGEQLQQQQADGHDHDHARPRARREQHADEHHVDEPEQEHRQQHPGLQTGVATEVGAGGGHRAHSGRRAYRPAKAIISPRWLAARPSPRSFPSAAASTSAAAWRSAAAT